MNTKLLEQIGLSEEEAKVYSTLVTNGTLQARKIAYDSKVNRSLVYKILKKLSSYGLIEENTDQGKISRFTALHPSKLHDLVKKKEEELKLADHAFHEAVSTLGAQFNLMCGKPTVRFYEGVEGIKILYKDILHIGKDIKLIRSPYDKRTPELDTVVKKQIQSQIERNIKAKIIAPMEVLYDETLKKRDGAELVTRCRVPKEEMDIKAQVIIYGEKVAFTSFADCMITTIVEDKTIAETFSILFESLWKKYQGK